LGPIASLDEREQGKISCPCGIKLCHLAHSLITKLTEHTQLSTTSN